MRVSITRFDIEASPKSWIQHYDVPLSGNGDHSIMDVLDYIYENIDGTLAYYRHSVCNQGICGRCAAKINGVVKLTCVYPARGEELHIEPKNGTLIKDLVVK